MLSRSFDRAFRHLVRAFTYHADVPRDPTDVSELGIARWNLELARRTMANERRKISQHRPQRPQVILRAAVSPDELARLRVMGIGSGPT